MGVDAPEPPEQVASLSTAPPLTNLWTSAWPADRLSKHDTDRKTVGEKGGKEEGREEWDEKKTADEESGQDMSAGNSLV